MVKIVSVVRDMSMYEKCIGKNPCCMGCELVCIDNSKENVPIPVRYNAILDSCDYDCWLVFCHEDWRPLKPVNAMIETLDKGMLYGTVGPFLIKVPFWGLFSAINGWVKMTDKAGKKQYTINGYAKEGYVSTFDCMCIVMHTSLVRRHNLRFDPAFRFDLYVEDFCAAAALNAGIKCRTIALPAIHYSYGVLGKRFYTTLEAVRRKYADSDIIFKSIAGVNSYFGNTKELLEHKIHHLHRPVLLKLYQVIASINYWR